ncbi:MAG: hypothetical protein AAB400_00270 [Patescibacteria group bacterium]
MQGDVFAVASKYTGEADIRAHVATLRTGLTMTLSEVEKNLLEKFKELKECDEMLTAQKTKLKELYEIEESAGALIAMLQAREDTKRNADRERVETEQKRKRDEEEYAFSFSFQKRKDKEAYEAEKRKLESELETKQADFDQRQKEFAAKEDELVALHTQVQEFPATLIKEKKHTEEQVAAAAAKDKEIVLLIASKEADALKTVLEGKIETLQATNEECKKLITSLHEQLKASHVQIQEVVLKSIESAAGAKTLDAVNKLALEQTRSSGGRS